MKLSEEDKHRFFNMVCPEYRSLAEDLLDGKIDVLYIGYAYTGYSPCTYTGNTIKNYSGLGQVYIEIFENSTDEPSKVIMLHATKDHMAPDDFYTIRRITSSYGDKYEYDMLNKSDANDELRWELLKMYVEDPELCSVIMRRKFKKIYDELSDSDKLLLEVADDNKYWEFKWHSAK